ncbi:MAG: DUF3857 domain-containing protein [Acidobacteriaceae bacterium]|nr:DUF3857 domain-containing protein [Acidobacteriaceae bacterium]
MPRRFVLLACFFSIFLGSALQAATWRPVTPQELSLKKSSSDPEADVEGLFREVRVLNESATFGYPHNVISEYVRLKIFTDRGKNKYGTVQIPYWGKSIISEVAGRTIKPDGSIVELGKDAIFKDVVVKKSGRKVKVVSFAMPAVEPGVIIEYRWTNNVGEFISRYVPLGVQSEFPTDEVIFHIKPVTSQIVSWPTMRYMQFGCQVERGPVDHEGFTTLTVHNVPAFHEEPLMPPEYSAKQWVLIYYEENSKFDTGGYWKTLGREAYNRYSQQVKVNGDVKNIAATATAGAKTDDEKLARLLEYCRKNLKDINGPTITTEEREANKGNRTTVDTLKRGTGTAEDINFAFAALATAAGFETRFAKLADRGTFLFDPVMRSAFFLNTFDIAVRIDNQWKFFDVTNPNVPAGVLPWREEGVPALITDPKEPEFVPTPLLSSDESKIARFGILKLSIEGALEGDIREIYMGNKATEWRERYRTANNTEREEDLRRELKNRFAQFELTNVKFNAVDDVAKPVGVVYHIRVEGYAQRTGKRLFVRPAYFQAGIGSPFTAGTRQHPICFEYPWSEMDTITIELPEGYGLDHPDAPSPLSFDPVGSYSVKILLPKPNTIEYHRLLVFGKDKLLMYDKKAYPAFKQIFDGIHERDSHMLTLKAEAPTAASGTAQ